eukprot:447481-Pelagomonas_calceolata.AAC.3
MAGMRIYHASTLERVLAHAHTNVHTHIHTHTDTQRTHTHARTHARVHTHTHILFFCRGALPVGEPLHAQVDPSSYAPSEMYESSGLERDNSSLEHPYVADLPGTGPAGPEGRGFQGKADHMHHRLG